MANNTSSDQPLTPGHTNSPLFTILPYDVRVLIYREVFNGSKVEVVYRSERADPANRHSVFTHICLPVNRQFDLVRVCKEAYKESRHIYWTETAIKLAHTPLRTNLDGIPMCAKQRIRALEGVPLVDELYATHQIPLDHFLGHFPKLKYCQFRRGTVRMDCHYNEIPPEGLVKKSGSDAFRDLALSLNARNPPVFVQKISLWPAKDHGRVVSVYANHTQVRFFVTRIGSVSDEEGFQRVTGPEEHIEDTHEPAAVHEEHDSDHGHDLHQTSVTDDATEVGQDDDPYKYDKSDESANESNNDDE